jgi:hypothetical protein
MDSMVLLIVGLFVVGMGFSLWALLFPDAWMRVDRVTWGWMLKDGYDTELSESGRSWIRIRGVIGILATLIACGVLFSIHAGSIARQEALEEQQAREEELRDTAGAWGAGGDGLRVRIPTGGAPSDSIAPEEIAATVAGFQPVQDDGASPEYLRELPVFRTGNDLVMREDELAAVFTSADLLLGTTSVCDVSSVLVTSEADRVILDVVYASTTSFRVTLTCTRRSIGSVDLTPIDLPEPLGDRTVVMADGTPLPEIRTP